MTGSAPVLVVVDRYQSHPGTAPEVDSTTTVPQGAVTATIALTPQQTAGRAQVRTVGATSAALDFKTCPT